MTHIILAQTEEEKSEDVSLGEKITSEGPDINWSGFIDVFYAFDFNKPVENFRQEFFYNHNRHNEFNINLALVKLNVSHKRYRANLGIQTGTYAMDNYAMEDDLLKPINEANIGVSLNSNNTLWLDAGIFASHMGFESAISADNLTLTRSLAAENSPYFLSGAKITWNPTEALLISGTVSNGWQHIKRVRGNSFPGIGTQVTYTTEAITLNWSTFVCSEFRDPERRIRYFNNFYGILSPAERIKVIAGIDLGLQESVRNSSTYEMWVVPTVIGSFEISNVWRTAIRAEYFGDKTSVIIPTNSANGFRTSSFSFNLDYMPDPILMARIEMRYLKSKDNIFLKNNDKNIFPSGTRRTNDDFFIVGSLAVKINN